jgi:mono/diheme cytochrome c family protein
MLHRNFALCVGIVLTFLWIAEMGAFAQGQKSEHENGSSAASVARGKYLVDGVARCGQCHTPHDDSGGQDRARTLQGAPVPFLPARPNANWPINAPRIGGTPLPASDADMVKLLTTGIWTTGNPLRAPMPEFHMNRSDAEAVVAYLKSVNPQP